MEFTKEELSLLAEYVYSDLESNTVNIDTWEDEILDGNYDVFDIEYSELMVLIDLYRKLRPYKWVK